MEFFPAVIIIFSVIILIVLVVVGFYAFFTRDQKVTVSNDSNTPPTSGNQRRPPVRQCSPTSGNQCHSVPIGQYPTSGNQCHPVPVGQCPQMNFAPLDTGAFFTQDDFQYENPSIDFSDDIDQMRPSTTEKRVSTFNMGQGLSYMPAVPPEQKNVVYESNFRGYTGPIPSEQKNVAYDPVPDFGNNQEFSDDPDFGDYQLDLSSNNSQDVVSPFTLKEEKFISRNSPEGVVADVATFSSSILFLMKSGRVIRKRISDGSKDVINLNIYPTRMESFGGYLYAVSGGKLYQLNNDTYDSKSWEFKITSWSPSGIIYTSTNPVKDFLWIQTDGSGYLYDKSLTAISTMRFPKDLRRNYGQLFAKPQSTVMDRKYC